MKERLHSYALLVSSELEELSQFLAMEGIDHDADFLKATAKYLEEAFLKLTPRFRRQRK